MKFQRFDELLGFWAEKTPEAPALVFEDGKGEKQTWSYRELLAQTRRKAEEYRASGRTCLGVLADGSRDCVVAVFGAAAAGLQVVMLDENIPAEQLRALLAYTDVDLLWGDEELCEELSGALGGGVTDGAGKILFFTSGTTERSKAVVLTEKSLCASAWNGGQKLPLQPEDRLLCLLPLAHVFGFVCGLLWGLSCGASVALGRGARHYADDCAYFEPTAVSVVPLLLGFLLQRRLVNPGLKLVLVGAGDCPAALLGAAAAMGLRVSFGYGLTETSSGVAISVRGDPFAMEICPDDEITLAPDGEILISAPTCMMQGYYKRPDATAAVLQNGVFHTGDLGRFDVEGRLHITGRKKDMLVLADGTKLFLPEYEGQLAAVLGTQELAVALRGGRPVLVFAGEGSERELLARLRPVMEERPRGQHLTGVVFVKGPLPRTATGKIMRWELQQRIER
ncbi:MAG: acyl--CoA ligase [Oscillospiraceae bacterium]|nr:acyl--CoA ligase [Oscillospiraceae bacterium]